MDTHALSVPTTHFIAGRAGFTVKYIILHAVYGEPGQTAYDIGRKFQVEPDLPEITHYVIDKIGHLVQCISERDRSWANGIVDDGAEPWFRQNAMEQSIAISFVKNNPQNMDEITPHQRSALLSLMRRIIRRNPAVRWAKANENGGIIGHFAMAPISNFGCPGIFDWDDLWMRLRLAAAAPPSPPRPSPPAPPGPGPAPRQWGQRRQRWGPDVGSACSIN